MVDKLCTIVLFSVDFNFLNKYSSRELMYSAESFGQLAEEQFGSQKYHRIITRDTNKLTTLDLILQKHWTAALCRSNDAKSCYDRIVLALAELCIQQQDIPLLTTLQNMEHTIWMMFGDSTSMWGEDIFTVPIHGVRQGNGAGPTIWTVMSSPVLHLLQKMGFGASSMWQLVVVKSGLWDTSLLMMPIRFKLLLALRIVLIQSMENCKKQWTYEEGGLLLPVEHSNQIRPFGMQLNLTRMRTVTGISKRHGRYTWKYLSWTTMGPVSPWTSWIPTLSKRQWESNSAHQDAWHSRLKP